MPKVTMVLTDRDAANAEVIRHATSARSKAHAISIALALTRYVVAALLDGRQLLLQDTNGEDVRVVMPELENLRGDQSAARRASSRSG